MHIVIFNAYYPPEVASSMYLEEDIAEGFALSGNRVTMYVPTPSRGVSAEVRKAYQNIKEEYFYNNHLHILRYGLMREGRNPIIRALRYIFQNIIQFYKGMISQSVDVIFSGSTPPTQGLMCSFLKQALRKTRNKNTAFVYNLQDVFPDSLVTTGLSKKGSLIWKIGRKMEDYTYRNADRIIAISDSMKQNIVDKGVPEEKVVVVSNWIDLDQTVPVPKAKNGLFAELGISAERFTVVYAGNLGAAQGADVILETAKLLPEVQFVIFGGGSEYADMKRKADAMPNVIMNGLLPQERVSDVYSLGDVCLITCKKNVGNSGMPSKTWSIMACNTPIIASFDTDSDLARTIEAASAGACVQPENPRALADAILKWKESEPRHTDTRAYVYKHASKTACVTKYVELVNECGVKQ